MYPQLRVFDPVTKSTSFSLPLEDTARPSPYLYFDTTGGAIVATIDASRFTYAAELVLVKLDGAALMSIVAPADWITPGSTPLPFSDTAQGGASWRVIIDGIKKLVLVLSISTSSGGGSPQAALLKFSGTLTPGAGVTRWYADASPDGGDTASIGYPLPRGVTFSDIYLNLRTNTSDQPSNYAILKNGAPTALSLLNQPAGSTGVVHHGSEAVDFAINDRLDFSAQSAAANGAITFSAMLFGLFDP
jgi:hypothetical protein